MDIIVLGLLMMKGMTIYDLQKTISEQQLNFASSGSMGSIQAAIKKLLNKEMIIFDERFEKSINKKIYFITEVGKEYFLQKISMPMQNKMTNKELSKFFFMGFVKSELREGLIESYLKELEVELAKLEQVSTQLEAGRDVIIDDEMLNELKAKEAVSEFLTVENVKDINVFTLGTLDYALDLLKFEIEWFTKFKEKIKRENGGSEEG